MKICFFGSSLVSSYWNGAATYYRGMLKEIAALGHDITFFEPDAFERQAHRDIADPDWAKVVVYPATPDGWQRSHSRRPRKSADMLVKASGVGVFDQELEIAAADIPSKALRIYWDVDAPATLEAMANDPQHHLRRAIPSYDMVLTYGGGDGVVSAYRAVGARDCVPIYNALDPATHYSAPPKPRFCCDLGLLANRLPDREQRVETILHRCCTLLADKDLRARRLGLGNQGHACQSAQGRTCRNRRPQRILRLRPRHTECQSRQHGTLRLLSTDARVRGHRRRRLPDHRSMGRHRSFSRTWPRGPGGRDGRGGRGPHRAL